MINRNLRLNLILIPILKIPRSIIYCMPVFPDEFTTTWQKLPFYLCLQSELNVGSDLPIYGEKNTFTFFVFTFFLLAESNNILRNQCSLIQ